MKYLPLIWYGLWRKRGRTWLALVQIMFAFALFGLLHGFSGTVKHAIESSDAGSLLVHSRGGWSPLPVAHFARILQVKGISVANYADYFPATYQKPTQKLLVIATLPKNWATITTDLTFAPGAADALTRNRTGAVIGGTLARRYGWKVGDRIHLQSGVAQLDGSTDWAFDVVGTLEMNDPVLRPDHSDFIVINHGYYDEARRDGRGTVQQVIVKVIDAKHAAAVADAIDALFQNSPDETLTESMRELAQSQFQAIGDLDFIVRSITGAVLFSLLLSIGSLMMQGVRERTPELAVLKTVGFRDRALVMLLVTEALLLCSSAAGLGMGLAHGLFWLGARLNVIGGNRFIVPPSVLAMGTALALALALLSSLLPAWRALKLQVAEALVGR